MGWKKRSLSSNVSTPTAAATTPQATTAWPSVSTPNRTSSTATATGFTGPKSFKKAPKEEEEDIGGYKVGAYLMALYLDNTEKVCIVIHRKAKKGEDPSTFQYYIHWHNTNRRMDQWIQSTAILRESTEEEIKALKEKDAGTHGGGDEVTLATAAEKELDDKKTRGGGGGGGGGRKRKTDDAHALADPDEHDEHEGMDAASIREHEEVTKVKNVDFVELGKFRMTTWYFSPFPKEYFPDGHIDCLYFCEFCMAFFRHKEELRHHQARQACPRHPPGNEIYRNEGLAVFEVDGAVSKIYGQNLSYFAKLFLDHKTLYYDIDPFLFYVLCEVDNRGFHPVGYFSKEKYSEMGYNLACILTFPCYQRKGYGNFIIQFSYELTKKEEKVGSPEKPLSDLGLLSYRSYWTRKLLTILKDYSLGDISIMELARMTSIRTEDIISTLQSLNIIKYFNGQYLLVVTPELIEEQLQKTNKKGPQVDPSKLHWTPLQNDLFLNRRDKWSLKAKMQPNNED